MSYLFNHLIIKKSNFISYYKLIIIGKKKVEILNESVMTIYFLRL